MIVLILWAVLSFLLEVAPILLIAFLVLSIGRYKSAKKANQKEPGTFSEEEMKKRKLFLIVMVVIALVMAAISVGFIIVVANSIAYM